MHIGCIFGDIWLVLQMKSSLKNNYRENWINSLNFYQCVLERDQHLSFDSFSNPLSPFLSVINSSSLYSLNWLLPRLFYLCLTLFFSIGRYYSVSFRTSSLLSPHIESTPTRVSDHTSPSLSTYMVIYYRRVHVLLYHMYVVMHVGCKKLPSLVRLGLGTVHLNQSWSVYRNCSFSAPHALFCRAH